MSRKRSPRTPTHRAGAGLQPGGSQLRPQEGSTFPSPPETPAGKDLVATDGAGEPLGGGELIAGAAAVMTVDVVLPDAPSSHDGPRASGLRRWSVPWLILGATAGFVLAWLFLGSSGDGAALGEAPHTVRQNSASYRYINPLLECETDEESRAPRLRLMHNDIQADLVRLQQSRGAHELGVYYRDLDNGPWIGFGEDLQFTPASLVKVPVLLTILKQADRDPSLLARRILVTDVDEAGHQDSLRFEERAHAGREYSVYELLKLMIVFSDNVSANALMQIVDVTQLESTFREVGLPIDSLDGSDITLTVREYASFFRVLYNASYLSRRSSELALTLLAASSFREGLVAGTEGRHEVAHKFGLRQLPDAPDVVQLHDCGIIYAPGHPYLLCVMTRGSDQARLAALIREVASLFHRALERERAETAAR